MTSALNRPLPNGFPPVSTVRSYFYAWRDDGLLDEMNRKLVAAARPAEGRKAQPTAGIIDRQSAKPLKVVGGRAGHRSPEPQPWVVHGVVILKQPGAGRAKRV